MNISAQKAWRAKQIVLSEISKYDSSAQIVAEGNFYDYLVVSPRKGLKYGLEIKRSEFERTKRYSEYLQQLYQHQNEIDVPILLVSVNESSEEVKLGIVFSWFHKRPSVTKDIVLLKSSQETWNQVLNLFAVLVHIEGPAQFLQFDNLYVKKTLSLSIENHDRRMIQAELIYMRKLSLEYRMNAKERKSLQEKLHFYMYGYDLEEYPSDSLDKAIFKAIQKDLNKTTINNKLIVLNTDLYDLQRYREYHRGQVQVIIAPYLDGMSDAAIRLLSGFTELYVIVELYANMSKDRDYFNNRDFTYYEKADGWVSKIIEYRNDMATFKKLSDIIG